jgi:hypothetical protein
VPLLRRALMDENSSVERASSSPKMLMLTYAQIKKYSAETPTRREPTKNEEVSLVKQSAIANRISSRTDRTNSSARPARKVRERRTNV